MPKLSHECTLLEDWRRLLSVLALCAAPLFAAGCGSTSSTTTGPSPVKCGVQLRSASTDFPAAGGSATVTVTANRECGWTAQSDATWVTLANPANGRGDGTLTFNVATNSDPATRQAHITIEDQRVAISQQAGSCTLRLSSTYESVGPTGGERTIHVAASSGQCSWTASTRDPWITIAGSGPLAGDGDLRFQVAPTSGQSRKGTITIAGNDVTVAQSACGITVTPASVSMPPAGGSGTLAVQTTASCSWTAEADAGWIAVTNGASGSGPGEVRFTVQRSDAQNRTASIHIADQAVAVTQGSGCAVSVAPSALTVGPAGGTQTIDVTAGSGCGWAAASQEPWIAIASGGQGSGNGRVTLSIQPSSGAQRAGSVQIGDQIVSVTQGSGCTLTVNPSTLDVAAAGGTPTIDVTTAASCGWTARSQASWILLSSGSSGSGAGRIQVSVQSNSGPERTGTLLVGSQSITVRQANGCTYGVAPSTLQVAASGGSVPLSITTGPGCTWTADSDVPWLALASRTGTGPAQLQVSAAANNTPARSGTVTVAGQPVAVSQPSTCTFLIRPPSLSFDANGGLGSVLVIVGGRCSWTASSNSPWLRMVVGESGTGDGLVQFLTASNSGAARTGSLIIAAQPFVVTQSAR